MRFPDSARLAALLDAYLAGYFPMADPATGRLGWYSADPRAILPLEADGFHLPRSLARRLRSGRFQITTDQAFNRVTVQCAEPRPDRPDSWIDGRILRAYALLHRAGVAHSVEAWLPAATGTGEARLVGGIYGIAIGSAFIAESMFCRPELGGTDASKVCLAHLVAHLRARGFSLLDVQMANPHTERFGVIEIGRQEFLSRLHSAAARTPAWQPFEADLNIRALASRGDNCA